MSRPWHRPQDFCAIHINSSSMFLTILLQFQQFQQSKDFSLSILSSFKQFVLKGTRKSQVITRHSNLKVAFVVVLFLRPFPSARVEGPLRHEKRQRTELLVNAWRSEDRRKPAEFQHTASDCKRQVNLQAEADHVNLFFGRIVATWLSFCKASMMFKGVAGKHMIQYRVYCTLLHTFVCIMYI